jgi:GLPGLI family protein
MKNILLIISTICISIGTFAQKTVPNSAGQITFERKQDIIKILNKAKYLSQEEKDRMAQTWKNDSEYKQKMVLSFANNTSHYTHESEQEFSEDGTYSWRNDDFIIMRNFEKNTLYEIQQMLGKKYIIEDSLHTLNWKILNEIKDVAGYICMKATAYDSVKSQNIVAWFSSDLPVSAGPERFSGLPGTILETNVDDDAIILTATKVNINKDQVLPTLPKKVKGKKINLVAYNKMIMEFISQSEKMHEFAWGLRY